MLFGVNTPGGPRNIVLDGGPDAPTERGRGSCKKIRYPLISQERLKLESLARAVCAVHSMLPLPNYFGLLLLFVLLSCVC